MPVQYTPSRPQMVSIGKHRPWHLTQSSERTGIENNWFALTGRVVAVKVEMDGDLHLALQDATGDKPGLACNSLMNELHQCSVFERFCKEAESSRIECGLAH